MSGVSAPAPAWVDTLDVPAGGQDFLGLRAAPQRLGYALMDGITTVTPHIRYLALRQWMLDAYWRQARPDKAAGFREFALRVECAIVVGNLLAGRQDTFLVGSTQAAERLELGEDMIALGPVVKNPGAGIYAGACAQLGLETAVIDGTPRPVSAPTVERGAGLAKVVDAQLRSTRLGAMISDFGPPESASRADLLEFGAAVHLDRWSDAEREALREVIMPDEPPTAEPFRRRARWRLGTYAALLAMSSAAGLPTEAAVFTTAREGGHALPSMFWPVFDGWAVFGAQDLLVSVHEATMAAVTDALEDLPEGGDVAGTDLIQGLLSDEDGIDAALRDCGLLQDGEHFHGVTFNTIADRVERLTDMHAETRGGVRRWMGGLSEQNVGSLAISRSRTAAPLALLPVAWLLALRRVEPALLGQGPFAAHLGGGKLALAGGVRSRVTAWRRDNPALPAVLAQMAHLTVRHHLDVAWTRMQSNPRSDAAHLYAEGDRWRFRTRFEPGRAASRILNASRWSAQLGLVDAQGLTAAGQERLASAVEQLGQEPLA